MNKTLEEIVKDILYETQKLSRGQPSIAVLEKMTLVSKRLAKDLDEYIEAKTLSLQKFREFQDKLVSAFNATEAELTKLNGEIEKLKNYLSNASYNKLNQ